MKINKKIISVVISLLLLAVGGCALLNWAFNDHTFRYGDLYYHLFVGKEMQCFPIIGAKKKDVIYKDNIQDGNKPAMLIMTYISTKPISFLVSEYRKACANLGYRLNTAQSDETTLNYYPKGKYDELSVSISHYEKKTRVDIVFIYSLTYGKDG
jgi:hypothetical protein